MAVSFAMGFRILLCLAQGLLGEHSRDCQLDDSFRPCWVNSISCPVPWKASLSGCTRYHPYVYIYISISMYNVYVYILYHFHKYMSMYGICGGKSCEELKKLQALLSCWALWLLLVLRISELFGRDGYVYPPDIWGYHMAYSAIWQINDLIDEVWYRYNFCDHDLNHRQIVLTSADLLCLVI